MTDELNVDLDLDLWERELSDFRQLWTMTTRVEFWLMTVIAVVGLAVGWIIGWIV